MAYRISRNIEASVIEHLKDSVVSDWPGLTVEKAFSKVATLPALCVRSGNAVHSYLSVGERLTTRRVPIIIDVFCENDGQRLDLKDSIIDAVRGMIPYYTVGADFELTAAGQLVVEEITEVEVNLGVDKDQLHTTDRYRHRVTIYVSPTIVEG